MMPSSLTDQRHDGPGRHATANMVVSRAGVAALLALPSPLIALKKAAIGVPAALPTLQLLNASLVKSAR